jgi:type IV pilus assembly protein PilB
MDATARPVTDVVHDRRELRERLVDEHTLPAAHVGELLVAEGVLSRDALEAVLAEQRHGPREKIGRLLVRRGLATEEQVHRALARRLNIPFVQLAGFDIDPHALELVSADLARRHGAVPLMLDGERLVVAVENPGDPELVDLLQFVTGHHVVIVAASPADIDYAISTAYAPLDDAQLVREVERLTQPLHEHARGEHEPESGRPVVRLVQTLIIDAIRRRASDIHIRPREREAVVIFRIDGSLVPIQTVHRSALPSIVSRIKILGGMDISEHRLPQDGKARMTNRGRVIDLRISVIPAVHGESVVIRVLDATQGLRNVDQIGFSEDDERRFRNLLEHTQGLILVTGPTGSGKSTTLYAALQEVRRQDVNIVTVEDPVEYHLDGMNQIQVSASIGFTFPRALRHILRHDPDVIMVGEVRDAETARMAVESALTGHLVLSTLHTESAAASITRLLEIGVDAYLARTTLAGVLAQRLVRLNCPHCRRPEAVDASIRAELGVGEEETFLRGTGCDRCYGTGFQGRHAVYELLVVTPALRALIRDGADASELDAHARAEGMTTLTEHALAMARTGQVALTEVFRIRPA